MYIGRIVCVSMTADRRLCASYRVSSRSFPNRTAVLGEGKVSIIPKEGHEADIQKNPYIAYNCVRIVRGGEVAVVTNGSQTDPIAEKIESGMSPRDSLALNSLALDYEKDDYNTPRISAIVDRRDCSGCGCGLSPTGCPAAAGAMHPMSTLPCFPGGAEPPPQQEGFH